MDISEISKLAGDYEGAILQLNLTKNELVALLAMLQARIMARVYGDIPRAEIIPHSNVPVGLASEKPIPKVPNKPIKYDPVYDPPPPMEGDRPPERTPSSRVLAQPNDACVCAACNKVAYTVNRIVKDGDKIPDFLASYTPMPGVPKLNRSIEIMNVDGQISCDCPLCGANKSLYLTGRPILNG